MNHQLVFGLLILRTEKLATQYDNSTVYGWLQFLNIYFFLYTAYFPALNTHGLLTGQVILD